MTVEGIFMARVRFDRITNIVSVIGVSEMDRLEGCIGDNVDYGLAKKRVDELNRRLREKGARGQLIRARI